MYNFEGVEMCPCGCGWSTLNCGCGGGGNSKEQCKGCKCPGKENNGK